jgi:hypothetical protein
MVQDISIAPLAHAKMMAHAVKNSRTVAHGILLGKFDTNGLTVLDVLPVCHSTPTKPLLDMSLRLAESFCVSNEDEKNSEIVGWYSAPELQVQDSPGPVAVKIIRSIAQSLESKEPILITISNNEVDSFLKIEKTCDNDNLGFTIYGNDELNKSNHAYKSENIKTTSGSWKSLNEASVNVCLDDEVEIFDYEDHVSGGVENIKQKDWIRNEQIRKTIRQ